MNSNIPFRLNEIVLNNWLLHLQRILTKTWLFFIHIRQIAYFGYLLVCSEIVARSFPLTFFVFVQANFSYTLIYSSPSNLKHVLFCMYLLFRNRDLKCIVEIVFFLFNDCIDSKFIFLYSTVTFEVFNNSVF